MPLRGRLRETGRRHLRVSDLGGSDVAEKLDFHGRITIENSNEMRKALMRALRAKPADLSVDFSGVSYIDTSGLATLVEASRIAHKQGTKLSLTGVHDQPQYLLQISHFDKIFDIEGQKAST